MSMQRSYEEALSAIRLLRQDKLRRKGSRGIIPTITISEDDLKSKGKVVRKLSAALMKKIK